MLAFSALATLAFAASSALAGSSYSYGSDFRPSSSSQCDSSHQFYWRQGNYCLHNGGDSSNEGTPPSDKSCPSNQWYWHKNMKQCVPKSQSACQDSTPSCSSSSTSWGKSQWDDDSKCCHAVKTSGSSSSDCSSNQFWWSSDSSCVSNNHGSSGQSCPSKKTCPYNYQWYGGDNGQCVPNSSGDCNNPGKCAGTNYYWSSSDKCCLPGSSAGPRKRRVARVVEASLPLGNIDPARCPAGLTACPVAGAMNGSDYECLDPLKELESCGGCKSMGTGSDCTAISGARSVGCEVGQCAVYSCAVGYSISADRKTCVRNTVAGLTSQTRRRR